MTDIQERDDAPAHDDVPSEPGVAPVADGPRLGKLDPHAFTGFTRNSPIRRVVAEPAIGLLLPHALTLEVAHAKVGAGVQHHSSFRRRPVARLWATMDAALRLVWGDAEVARAAAQQVYTFHDHVNGDLPEPSAAHPDGASYSAHDASLLLWVWATLVQIPLVAHQRWLPSLTEAELDEYYVDMSTFAQFFGIPADMVPADRAAFDEYWESVLDGPALMPTATTKAVIHDILWFRHWMVPDFVTRPLRVMSIGTLDPRMRERFDLHLDRRDQRLFNVMDYRLKRYYRYRPAWLYQRIPEAYVALRKPTIGLVADRRSRKRRRKHA